MTLNAEVIATFQREVWTYFAAHKRAMPWREQFDPYGIMVSEIMLQQTQVDRVRPKFVAFMAAFPTVADLAAAPLSDVLAIWVGLGYNRRAKFLHSAAKEIMERYNGRFPQRHGELVGLPGIGPNTAGAIMAYAYNEPVVFIETNIRSVIIHHFFPQQEAGDEKVADADIADVAAQVLDRQRPREWYWALMDYGTFVKKTYGNNVKRAKSHRQQSAFEGSLRQIRGKVIALLVQETQSLDELEAVVADPRLPLVLQQLTAEKLIMTHNNRVQLAK